MNSVQVVAAILGILTFPRLAQTTFTVGELYGQEMAGTMHEHLTGVSCDDVPPGRERPEFGCFNIATEKGLQFEQPAGVLAYSDVREPRRRRCSQEHYRDRR